MPVSPLDLQTNFSTMTTIGKHISLENDNQMIRQDVINGHIQKESLKNAQDVPVVLQHNKDYAKIKDKNDKKQHNFYKNNDEDKENESDEEDNDEIKSKHKHNHFIDEPNIGQNVDIMC